MPQLCLEFIQTKEIKFLPVAKLTFLLLPPITLPPEILKCQIELPTPTLWNFIRLVIKTAFICIYLIIPMKQERNIRSLLSCHSQEMMCSLYNKIIFLALPQPEIWAFLIFLLPTCCCFFSSFCSPWEHHYFYFFFFFLLQGIKVDQTEAA